MPLEVVAEPRVPELRKANRAEAAEWFGVSQNTIHSWITRGCPYLVRGERGTPWVLDLLAIARWKYGAPDAADVDVNPETFDPKTRLDWYKGEAERLNVEKTRGELVPVADVTEAWGEQIQIAKGRLLALPARLSPDMVRVTDQREAERMIRAALIMILEELAGEQSAD